MNENVQIMIDLETLDVANTARILSIGVCSFNALTGAILTTFYVSLGPVNKEHRNKITTSERTKQWWNEQSPEAKAALEINRVSYHEGLKQFNAFMKSFKAQRIWANDPQFDLAILANSLRQYEISNPWKFYNERSFRTIVDITSALHTGDLRVQAKIPHHALEDAIAQAITVGNCFKALRGE